MVAIVAADIGVAVVTIGIAVVVIGLLYLYYFIIGILWVNVLCAHFLQQHRRLAKQWMNKQRTKERIKEKRTNERTNIYKDKTYEWMNKWTSVFKNSMLRVFTLFCFISDFIVFFPFFDCACMNARRFVCYHSTCAHMHIYICMYVFLYIYLHICFFLWLWAYVTLLEEGIIAALIDSSLP